MLHRPPSSDGKRKVENQCRWESHKNWPQSLQETETSRDSPLFPFQIKTEADTASETCEFLIWGDKQCL
jgi:hypothetical protein